MATDQTEAKLGKRRTSGSCIRCLFCCLKVSMGAGYLKSGKYGRTRPEQEKLRSQFGGSDMDTIWLVLIIVTLLTIAYLILGWVKSTKDEKVTRAGEAAAEAARARRAPQVRDNRAPSGHRVVF